MECPLRQLHNKASVIRILKDITEGRDSAERYLELQGKTLACLCTPAPCHCEVYVQVVRELLKPTKGGTARGQHPVTASVEK